MNNIIYIYMTINDFSNKDLITICVSSIIFCLIINYLDNKYLIN